jgi:hypothetical protein
MRQFAGLDGRKRQPINHHFRLTLDALVSNNRREEPHSDFTDNHLLVHTVLMSLSSPVYCSVTSQDFHGKRSFGSFVYLSAQPLATIAIVRTSRFDA